MEKMTGETLNITNENRKIIESNFPEAITEGKIDFEKLKELLGEFVDEQNEKYQFTWNGKGNALKISQTSSTGTLIPCKEKSVNWDSTENLYIEGDNLEVLKLLQKSYNRKIEMIYIDPPYNTGSDFVYKDNYKDNIKNYKERTFQENKANPETNGRFHTDWLNMIYPRLRLAKNLLADNGIIFISIDDNELEKLKIICNEIFGEINCIGIFSVENNPKGRKNSNFISVSNEYCLVYGKNITNENSKFIENIPKNEADMTIDENGDYIQSGGRRVLVGEQEFNNPVEFKSDKHYSVYYNLQENKLEIIKEKQLNDINEELIKKGYKRYVSYKDNIFVENTYTDKQFLKLFDENKLIFKDKKIYEKNSSTTVRIKSMLTNKKYNAIVDGKVVKNYEIDLKTTSAGTRLKDLFNLVEVPFSAPKNENFISLLASLLENKNLTCLDFFSGSATTAHAIMNLNAKDNGKRKFILIQLPESLNENLKSAGQLEKKNIQAAIDYLNSKDLPLYLSEIGKERIRLASKKIKDETNADVDYGFKVFKLDTSNLKLWDGSFEDEDDARKHFIEHVEPIVDGRNNIDVLYELLLKEGHSLTSPIEEIKFQDKVIYSIGLGYLLVCLETNIDMELVEEIGKRKPESIIFRDSGFKDENAKINTIQELKKHGISEEKIKSI
ncbi:MAG: site-specific DNA-methyltransferase [Tissierellia bacterium]|nr:site-specific DNA-methyltransferase [Tissierellia bacterium]